MSMDDDLYRVKSSAKDSVVVIIAALGRLHRRQRRGGHGGGWMVRQLIVAFTNKNTQQWRSIEIITQEATDLTLRGHNSPLSPR